MLEHKIAAVIRNAQGGAVAGTLTLRTCAPTDLDEIIALQKVVCSAIENPDTFVPTDRKEYACHLKTPHFIIGFFDGEMLVAYSSFVLPGEDPANYGWDLGWSLEKVRTCAKLDSIVVHPDYRGNHLQQRLIAATVELAPKKSGIKYLLTTVSPYNEYSLHNVQAMGFEVLMQKKKYGGKERFILCRTLF